MKKSFLNGNCVWMMALLLSALTFTFTGCTDDDDPVDASALVGVWEPIYAEGYDIYEGEKETWNGSVDAAEDGYGRIEFKADGTMAAYYYSNGEWKTETSSATYRVEGKTIYLYYGYDVDEDYETMTIVSLTDDRLVIEGSYSDPEYDEEGYEKVTCKKIR